MSSKANGKQWLWDNATIQTQIMEVPTKVSHYVLKLYWIQDCEESEERARSLPKQTTLHSEQTLKWLFESPLLLLRPTITVVLVPDEQRCNCSNKTREPHFRASVGMCVVTVTSLLEYDFRLSCLVEVSHRHLFEVSWFTN